MHLDAAKSWSNFIIYRCGHWLGQSERPYRDTGCRFWLYRLCRGNRCSWADGVLLKQENLGQFSRQPQRVVRNLLLEENSKSSINHAANYFLRPTRRCPLDVVAATCLCLCLCLCLSLRQQICWQQAASAATCAKPRVQKSLAQKRDLSRPIRLVVVCFACFFPEAKRRLPSRHNPVVAGKSHTYCCRHLVQQAELGARSSALAPVASSRAGWAHARKRVWPRYIKPARDRTQLAAPSCRLSAAETGVRGRSEPERLGSAPGANSKGTLIFYNTPSIPISYKIQTPNQLDNLQQF